MKNLITCLAILLASWTLVASQADSETGVILPASADLDIDCNGAMAVFCGDCTTVAVCSGIGKAMAMPCPSGTPYCLDGTCTTSPNADDATCTELAFQNAEKCTSEGYFPNPTNCNEYWYCYEPSKIMPPVIYACPTGYVFDPLNYRCKRRVYSSDCPTLKCTKAASFIAYPLNNNYYGFCKTLTEILMYKCPNGLVFNLTTYGCEFKCTGAGYFAAPNPNQFYLCTLVSGKYVAQLSSCPEGWVYSSATQNCVK